MHHFCLPVSNKDLNQTTNELEHPFTTKRDTVCSYYPLVDKMRTAVEVQRASHITTVQNKINF